jgi:hypothetical protein
MTGQTTVIESRGFIDPADSRHHAVGTVGFRPKAGNRLLNAPGTP